MFQYEGSHNSNSKLRLSQKPWVPYFQNICQTILQFKILLQCHHEACSRHSLLRIKSSRSSNSNLRLCHNPSSVIPNFMSFNLKFCCGASTLRPTPHHEFKAITPPIAKWKAPNLLQTLLAKLKASECEFRP